MKQPLGCSKHCDKWSHATSNYSTRLALLLTDLVPAAPKLSTSPEPRNLSGCESSEISKDQSGKWLKIWTSVTQPPVQSSERISSSSPTSSKTFTTWLPVIWSYGFKDVSSCCGVFLLARIRLLCSTMRNSSLCFTMEAAINRQNDCIIAPDVSAANSSGRNIGRKTHPQSVMVWIVATSDEKSPLTFVKKGLKINKEVYQKTIFEDILLPWTQTNFRQRSWTCQRDSTLAHKAKSMQ